LFPVKFFVFLPSQKKVLRFSVGVFVRRRRELFSVLPSCALDLASWIWSPARCVPDLGACFVSCTVLFWSVTAECSRRGNSSRKPSAVRRQGFSFPLDFPFRAPGFFAVRFSVRLSDPAHERTRRPGFQRQIFLLPKVFVFPIVFASSRADHWLDSRRQVSVRKPVLVPRSRFIASRFRCLLRLVLFFAAEFKSRCHSFAPVFGSGFCVRRAKNFLPRFSFSRCRPRAPVLGVLVRSGRSH
jgi:hypothetical protein